MARYQLILAYDGTRFEGSQRQAGKRTAQGELEKALRTVGWTGRSVLIAGRTDSGVHAAGQSVTADLEWVHGPDKLRAALNAALPPDMSVRMVSEASPDFHPRFDASSRSYCYSLFCDPVRDPVRERYAWRVWPEVESEVLEKVCMVFLGTHDYSAFGSPVSRGGSTVRTILTSEWNLSEGMWQYRVQANAFLYRMVRRLVHVQVATAQGRLIPGQIVQALENQTRLPAGLAPAHGLSLVKVTYKDQQ
jgi:tRNA pseudouridine38-40 synthase